MAVAAQTTTERLAHPNIKVDAKNLVSPSDTLRAQIGQKVGIKIYGEHGNYATGTLVVQKENELERYFIDFDPEPLFEKPKEINPGDWLYFSPLP